MVYKVIGKCSVCVPHYLAKFAADVSLLPEMKLCTLSGLLARPCDSLLDLLIFFFFFFLPMEREKKITTVKMHNNLREYFDKL